MYKASESQTMEAPMMEDIFEISDQILIMSHYWFLKQWTKLDRGSQRLKTKVSLLHKMLIYFCTLT